MTINIQQLSEQNEWVDFKLNDSWDNAVNEVCILNSKEISNKYRVITTIDCLTYIYCSCFYVLSSQ